MLRSYSEGLIQTIWIHDENISKANELLSTYDLRRPYEVAQEKNVRKISGNLCKSPCNPYNCLI